MSVTIPQKRTKVFLGQQAKCADNDLRLIRNVIQRLKGVYEEAALQTGLI